MLKFPLPKNLHISLSRHEHHTILFYVGTPYTSSRFVVDDHDSGTGDLLENGIFVVKYRYVGNLCAHTAPFYTNTGKRVPEKGFNIPGPTYAPHMAQQANAKRCLTYVAPYFETPEEARLWTIGRGPTIHNKSGISLISLTELFAQPLFLFANVRTFGFVERQTSALEEEPCKE